MGKPRQTEVRELEECPLFMTIEEVVRYMGFGRPVVDRWFKDSTFPVIKDGIKKVNKYALIDWLNKTYGSYIYKDTLISYNLISKIVKQVLEVETTIVNEVTHEL